MFPCARRLKTSVKRTMVPLARRISGPASALPIELWGMYVDAEGRLCYAGRDVLGLVREAGETPVHLLDAARLDANLAAFQRFGAEVYYSFKTQPLPWVIRRLMALGAGAEVISEYELRLALHLGAPAHKIIFNGPGKTDASIRRLPKLSSGDVLMIMDSGAYFEPDSTSFSFRRPGTLAVENKVAFTIRRSESFADMIDRDVYC